MMRPQQAGQAWTLRSGEVRRGEVRSGETRPPTFIINPLERDGLLLGNAARGPHLLTKLLEGQSRCQLCDQHVPGWEEHGQHDTTEPPAAAQSVLLVESEEKEKHLLRDVNNE